METRKSKLIKSLKLAINALKNDTIFYDWHNQESCNCGVVAQAILGKDSDEIEQSFLKITEALEKKAKRLKGDEDDEEDGKIDSTWKNAVKHLCSITGKSNIEILNNLIESGLEKDDIVHLEYLENEAILEKSEINTEDENYFKDKENLILYLSAWVKILEEGVRYKKGDILTERSLAELQTELLNAKAEENFEYAAELRDEINLR